MICIHGEYTLDGEPVDIQAFIRENDFDQETVLEIADLQPGFSMWFGGGAGQERMLRRES